MAKAVLTSASTRAIDKVKEGYPNAKGFRCREEVQIGGIETGELCYIEFDDPKDGENEVYVFVKPDTARIFDDVPSLLRFVQGNIPKKVGWVAAVIANLLDVGGIAGLVAITMVITVCALSIINRSLVLPELWQPAILTIIGFYFGTKTQTKPH
ncbi:hypothetical protein [Bradyrhizobium nanningense]|nr:hypothetical protein [Bradyrhizobium nanningense]